MPRRTLALTALAAAALAVTGCGATRAGEIDKIDKTAPPPPAPTQERTLDEDEAAEAYTLLGELERAWRERDCHTVRALTAGAERTLGGRACDAAGKGRPAPRLDAPEDPVFLFPAEETADLWFAALTREPDPAYWVFAWREGGWKLVAGALPLDGEAPDAAPTGIGPAETAAVQATLVPQSHLSYLTDPAGLTGISFPSGDPVRDLRDELRDRPARVRPDRLTADVDLSADEPARTLALADGGALVFHTVEITFRQRPRSGAKTPAHPIYGKRDLRAFTGTAKPSRITGTELLILATRVAVDGSLSTVASRRVVTDVTTG